jgi:hypothetical protein
MTTIFCTVESSSLYRPRPVQDNANISKGTAPSPQKVLVNRDPPTIQPEIQSITIFSLASKRFKCVNPPFSLASKTSRSTL